MSTPVNMAAIDAMGSQFTSNIFKDLNRKAIRTGRRIQRKNAANTTFNSKGPVPPIKPAPTQPIRGTVLGPGSPAPKGITTGKFAPPFTPGATPHSNTGPNFMAIGSGRKPIATPYNPPPRVIPMSGNAALTNRVNPNFSFSDNKGASPINRTQFNQPSSNPFSISTPTALGRDVDRPAYANTPGFSHPVTTALPVAGKAAPSVGPQFADVSTKDNSPYPTHVHPEGSSNQILPNLTAAQPRPNQFTVGSRNVKGGGIAAMGSQLEAGLSARPLSVPQPRKRV